MMGPSRRGRRPRPPDEEPPAEVLDLGRARRVRSLLAALAEAVQRTDPQRTAAAFAGELPGLEEAMTAGPAPCSIIGVDPGLAALGLARLALLPNGERVEAVEVIRTQKSNRKRELLAAEDNVARIGELAEALAPWFALPGTVAICAESQSWPRNAGACAKVGMAWGVIVALARRHGLPVLQASPQEVKRATAGRRDASKEEVRAALELRYPKRPPWPEPAGIVEHASDALGAAVACLEHPTVKVARRLLAA